MTRVAIVGASGFVGGELLRILLGHPNVEIVAATSTKFAGRSVATVHPNLRRFSDLRKPFLKFLVLLEDQFAQLRFGNDREIRIRIARANSAAKCRRRKQHN